MSPELEVFVEVQHFYGRQSLAIDRGEAADWAAMFTADGVFDSPTYPDPVVGTSALEEFARTVHRGNQHLHHIVTNVALDDVTDDAVLVRANLLIVTTHDITTGEARIERITTITDQFRRLPELRLHHRLVVRDGQPDPLKKELPTHD
ncbi:nuclear transport factor 2 family protein [Nocardioides sp. NPDC059952]|uniref:nuclear transport factor 2 family protein n=1 Tax=Nocardioides sp. NPDC059952 TaxID=3347014 RepID=UPI003652E007